jgi:kynurenine formamidase
MPRPLTDAEQDWVAGLAGQHPFGHRDRLGSLNHIDAAARRRAAGAMRTGAAVSLARPLAPDQDGTGFSVAVRRIDRATPGTLSLSASVDHLETDCHGIANTHIDALNHQGSAGTWYSGWEIDGADGPSVLDWSAGGIVTRGVHADITALRGTDWADAGQPVSGAEIDAALARAGLVFERGDALLLDMGRDRAEAAGYVMTKAADPTPRPGLGLSGAEWIAGHGVSVLCWDFIDAIHPAEPWPSTHLLIWAIGLVIVDNCDFGALRAAAAPAAGGLVLAPLPIPGGTGCLISPLLIS